MKKPRPARSGRGESRQSDKRLRTGALPYDPIDPVCLVLLPYCPTLPTHNPIHPESGEIPDQDRRSAFGKQRYGALGNSPEDRETRKRIAAQNWNFFGAPAGLFCYIDRDLGLPQWADVGGYLQTAMLLLRAER